MCATITHMWPTCMQIGDEVPQQAQLVAAVSQRMRETEGQLPAVLRQVRPRCMGERLGPTP